VIVYFLIWVCYIAALWYVGGKLDGPFLFFMGVQSVFLGEFCKLMLLVLCGYRVA